MTPVFWVSAALALAGLIYLAIAFTELVLGDLACGRETREDAGRSGDTAAWLRSLRTPDSSEDETWRRHGALVERETGARP